MNVHDEPSATLVLVKMCMSCDLNLGSGVNVIAVQSTRNDIMVSLVRRAHNRPILLRNHT